MTAWGTASFHLPAQRARPATTHDDGQPGLTVYLRADDIERPARVSVHGRLDLRTGPLLSRLVDQLIGRGRCTVILDAGDLVVRGAEGAAVLVQVRSALENAGGWLLVERPRRRTLPWLQRAGLALAEPV